MGSMVISQKCGRGHSSPLYKTTSTAKIITKYTYMHDYKISGHSGRGSLNLGDREG